MLSTIAKKLDQAAATANSVEQISNTTALSLADAYQVQKLSINERLRRGEKLVGYKMGFTSHAKMKQMGVEKPCYGFLADYFSVPDGGEIKHDELIHPKIEAELAFVTKKALKGPGVHIADVLAATDFVMPAVEVIDSRYKDFKFDLKSVIADNSSSTRFVTGGQMKPVSQLDLKNLGVVMEVNGEVVEVGAGAAVLGHPAASVAMLANMLGERGEELPAGSFVMIGAITAAVHINKGDNFTVRYQDLGTLSGKFV